MDTLKEFILPTEALSQDARYSTCGISFHSANLAPLKEISLSFSVPAENRAFNLGAVLF